MERKPEIISRDIATFERKLAEAGDNAVLKEALNKKLVKLKQELKGGQMSTRQLASNLLGARRKISALSGTEFRALILRLSKKPEYAFLKRYSNQKVRDDMERPAKPVGYRFKGRGNYDKPTPRQIRKGKADGTVYYEARPRRSDVNRVIQLGKGGSISDIAFANSNLYLYGFGKDINGNTIVKVGFPNQRAFSIQTNGVLKFTHTKKSIKLSELDNKDIDKIEKEVVEYVKDYGSKQQKLSLKTYEKGGSMYAKGGNVPKTYIIGSDTAEIYDYDLESLQEEFLSFVNNSNETEKTYEEGKDFEFAIGRGDDFPNAIIITNQNLLKKLLADKEAIYFLKDLKGDGKYAKGGRIDISDLVIGTDYAIVDFGMGYWLTDWTYQGERRPNEYVFTSSRQMDSNLQMFTEDELLEYLEDGAITENENVVDFEAFTKFAKGGGVGKDKLNLKILEGHWHSYYKGVKGGQKDDGYVTIKNENDLQDYIKSKLGDVIKSIELLEKGKRYPYNRDNPYSHDFYLITLKNGQKFNLERQYGVPNWSGNVDYVERISISENKKYSDGGGVESDCTAAYYMLQNFIQMSNDEYIQDANIVPYIETNGVIVSYTQNGKKVAVIVYNPRMEKLSIASVVSNVMSMFPVNVQAKINSFATKYNINSPKLCSASLIKIVNHNGEVVEEFEHYAKGGGVSKRNYTYIPQDEIDYLVTEYGKKIDGSKLLDGAYAKGKTKSPKIVRTQFEDEDFEFAIGGEVDVDFGIEITSNTESKRNKSLGTHSLKRISSILSEYKSESPDYIDMMVSNMCQNLTNKQIAQAYIHLKVYDKMKNTESVKRAIKSNKMAKGGGIKENNYRISVAKNDKYIGEYPEPISDIDEAKTIFAQLETKYKLPIYSISVWKRATSTSGMQKINVSSWYKNNDKYAKGGGIDSNDFKAKINLGKIAYEGRSRKNNAVQIEVSLKTKEKGVNWNTLKKENDVTVFSMSGGIWNASKSDMISGGQNLDEIAKYFKSNRKVKELIGYWEEYHLNDMNAGTKKQTEAIEKWIKQGNRYDYSKALEYLESIDLDVDKGYKYGSQWLYKPIPKKAVDRIIKLCKELQEEMFEDGGSVFAAKKKMSEGGRIDLFEDYENIPSEVQEILKEYELEDNSYDVLDELLNRLEAVGYTFSYGLDAEPFGLRPIGVNLNELRGYEDEDDDDKMETGGSIPSVFVIGSNVARDRYNYDIEQLLEDFLENVGDYHHGKTFEEDNDFAFIVGRGDDFPNAISFMNIDFLKMIMQDEKAMSFLKGLKGNGKYAKGGKVIEENEVITLSVKIKAGELLSNFINPYTFKKIDSNTINSQQFKRLVKGVQEDLNLWWEYNGKGKIPSDLIWRWNAKVDKRGFNGRENGIEIRFANGGSMYAKGGCMYEEGGHIDLFEDYENIPPKIQAILDRYSEDFGGDGSDMDYKDTANMLEEVEAVGYTFGYGLDNEPYGLRPIGVKLNELRDYEDFDDEEMATGGSIGEELMGGQPGKSKPSGYTLISKKGNHIIVSEDEGKTKEKWVKNNGYSGYTLHYAGNQYEFVDSFADGGNIADVQRWIEYDGYSDSEIEAVFEGLEDAGYVFPANYKIYETYSPDRFQQKAWETAAEMANDVRMAVLPSRLQRKDVEAIIWGMLMVGSTQYGVGGDVKAFFAATKHTLKKGYEKTKEYTKKQIHDGKKKVALDVLDDTKRKVSKQDKTHLRAAQKLVETKFAKGGRAWSGGIENIDNLFSWMYDEGILTKTEKDEKDKKFRAYYRYYNDGDFPRALASKGISSYSNPDRIKNALEEYIEEFIKRILKKYQGKYNRREFHITQNIKDLERLHYRVIGDYNPSTQRGLYPEPYHVLYDYDKEIELTNPEFKQLVRELRPLYKDIKKESAQIIEEQTRNGIYKGKSGYEVPSESNGIYWQREKLKAGKVWTAVAESKFQKMQDIMDKMNEILTKIIAKKQKIKQLIKNEPKYKDGGSIDTDKSYYRVFKNSQGKDIPVKIAPNPIMNKYDYYVNGGLRGSFKTYEDAEKEVSRENFELYRDGGNIGELDWKAQRFLDTIRIANGDIELKDVKVHSTQKGNWAVYWKDRSLMTVQGYLLDDDTIMKYNLEYHTPFEDEFRDGGSIGESGLMVIGRTQSDNTKIGEIVDENDFYAEWNSREGYWLFPEEVENYDDLEETLSDLFEREDINARFEGIFATGGGIKPSEFETKGATIYINGTKADVKKMYLDYVNNYLTIGKFADDYNVSDKQAKMIIESGRKYANEDGVYKKGGCMYSEGGEITGKYALVSLGGSIGSKVKHPVYVNSKVGSIIATSDDKEELTQKAKRMRKNLSEGERKYYGMNYTVIELTPAKLKEIEMLSRNQ